MYSRDVKFYETVFRYKMSKSTKSYVESQNKVTKLNFFDIVESETTSKNPNSSPNDVEEGIPVSRESSVHQPGSGGDISQPRFDEHIPHLGLDLVMNQSGHDGLHTAALVANYVLAHKETEDDKYLLNITNYQKSHFNIRLRVLRYLKLAPESGIDFLKNKYEFKVASFSDSDWAKCRMTKRSVSWSLAEDEYRAMTSTTCEVMRILKILKDLGKKERVKSIALKAKKDSSDDETLTSESDDEEYDMAIRNFKEFFRRKGKFVRQQKEEKKSFRQRDKKKGKSDRKCFRGDDPNQLIGDCPKPSCNKEQKAFIGGSWSDSENDAEDKTNDETCLMAQSSNEKQTTLAISTTEAEYVFAGKACQQALWMKQALIDYGIRLDDVPIMCDNKGAIDLSKNHVQHSRTKHIETHHHFQRDNVQKGNITIEKVASEDNIADIFTKPLKREVFNYLRLGLGMMELIMDSDSSSSQN
nr:copia protein [Tanacetum cinerariifolium]